MRLAVCTLSAVLLSGCSWLGIGGNSSGYSHYQMGGSSAYGCGANTAGGGYGVNQYAGQYTGAQSSYGYGQSQAGCGAAGAYGVAGNGYQGQAGYGANGYGASAHGFGAGAAGYGGMGANGYGPGAAGYGAGASGYNSGRYGASAGGNGAGFGAHGFAGANGAGLRGAQGYGGYSSYGASGAGTVLNGAAPYGAAVGGGTQFASSGQYVNGQYANSQWVTGGSSSVQTIQGAPIYVPQPYPAYYGVGYNAGYAGGGCAGGYASGSQCWRGASAAMPFGIEAGIGTEFGIGGNIVDAKPAGVATGGTLNVSATPAISYADAYKKAVSYDLAATYDISPSTTLLARVGYSDAEGQLIRTGTIDDGVITEDLFAQWGDLEQFTLEGGVRQYLGGWNNGVSGLRPYVGATGGFTHNNDVSLSQSSATLMPAGSNVQPYLDSGWTPTASGVIGAEMQVGARTAIGVETGIRWRDDIGSNVLQQEDRWSVPLKLRGRVSF